MPPSLEGGSPSISHIFQTSYLCPNSLTESDQIWHGSTRGACFQRSATPYSKGGWAPASRKLLGPLPTLTLFDLNRRHTRRLACLGVNHAPVPTGVCVAPVSHKIFGTSYIRAHSMKNSNRILHGYQIRRKYNFTRSTTNADARTVCGG